MDMWSDPNLAPYMAVTAHWLEGRSIKSPAGNYTGLTLRSELIGFVHVPNRHTGEHMSKVFLHILDRIDIAPKVCHLYIF